MTPSIGKKLALFVGIVVLLATGSVGVVSYNLMETKYAEVLRKDTLDAVTLLSSRVRNEMRHIAEKGRFFASAALEDFKNPDDQIRFLEDNLAIDEQFIALSLFRRSGASDNKWISVFRLTRPEEDPTHLEDEDFKQLDLKYPMDFGLVSEGAIEMTVGQLKDNTPILRMAVPIVKKKGASFTQLLQIEVRQEKITAAFAESTAHFSFILDRHGRVLTQTDPTHFTFGEDLSHLPILQMARTTEAPNGNLDYYELPGGVLQYGSFHKVGYADLIVVTQAPKSHILEILRMYTRQSLMIAAACFFASMALALLACWGFVGARLAKITATLARIRDGKFAVSFTDIHSADEISGFARRLQEVVDELRHREKMHGTHAKFKDKKLRQKLEEQKIPLTGERAKATVLTFQLKGIELAASQSDPSVLMPLLNTFATAFSTAVDRNEGIADNLAGGSFVAFWGVPFPAEQDSDHAMATATEIREFVKKLNEGLAKAKLPEVTLAMGLHHGPVIAGQIGPEDRLEYRVIGEAMEVALRVQAQTEQYGNDIILTAPMASLAPEWYSTSQIFAGDDKLPPLFELVGAAAKGSTSAEGSAPGEGDGTGEEEAPPPTIEDVFAAPAAADAASGDGSVKRKKKKKKIVAEDASAAEGDVAESAPAAEEPPPPPDADGSGEEAA